jgi:hypothetical protein
LLIAGAFVLILMKVLGPTESLDARFYYDQMEAWSFFQTLSEEESRRYCINELLDLCFIALYSRIFYLSLERISGWKKSFLSISLIPGTFDFFETSWILLVLKFGEISGPMLMLGWLTMAKWVSVAMFLVLLSILYFWKHPKKIRD